MTPLRRGDPYKGFEPKGTPIRRHVSLSCHVPVQDYDSKDGGQDKLDADVERLSNMGSSARSTYCRSFADTHHGCMPGERCVIGCGDTGIST